MARSARLDTFLRLSAAIVGVLPIAVYVGLGRARWAPAGPEARAALGFFSPLPVYALFACLAAPARSGWRAWAACGLATAVLKLLLVSL